tara:strand:+ start:46 stop:195 length:150 start_codon:yes stop_codon:yes gene_type:complete
MVLIKLFDDFLQMQADAAGMSREEYTAYYGVSEKNSDVTTSDDEDKKIK